MKSKTTSLFLNILVSVLLALSLSLGVSFEAWAQQDQLSQVQRVQQELEEELARLEREIAEQRQRLGQQRGQSASIQGEIDVLQTQINTTRLDIQRRNAQIQQLSGQISQKENIISELDQQLSREQASLAQLLRKLDELENVSLFAVVLSQKTISDYFIDRDNFAILKRQLQDSFENIQNIQQLTQAEREALEERRIAEADTRAALEEARRQVEREENEQRRLLQASRDEERTYEQIIQEREAQAAQIRSRLFELAGGSRPGEGIPFGDAVTFATEAEQLTGVRAALILAILSQESAMGRNVGTCNRPGDARTYRDIMPGPVHYRNYVNNGNSCTGAASPCSWRDDQSVFIQIMSELGLPPEGQPLSCPVAAGGWGGAMGPTQFIPSTWMTVREDVARLAGVPAANPWNARHAVIATGVYMSRLGASTGGFTAERNAACRYYSGRACGQSSMPNIFYGDQVMSKASNFQTDIDFLRNN